MLKIIVVGPGLHLPQKVSWITSNFLQIRLQNVLVAKVAHECCLGSYRITLKFDCSGLDDFSTLGGVTSWFNRSTQKHALTSPHRSSTCAVCHGRSTAETFNHSCVT